MKTLKNRAVIGGRDLGCWAMDERHLEPHLRVVVYLGGIASDINAQPPLCATGTVFGRVEDPNFMPGAWWVDVDLPTGGTLAQAYRPEEILGLATWLRTTA